MKKLSWKNLFLLLTAIFTLAACSPTTSEEDTSTATTTTELSAEENIVTVDLKVEGKAVEDTAKEVKIKKDDILLDVMKANYDVVEKDGFISSINGHEQDEEAGLYWTYTVNGEMATVGAGEYKLTPGDKVEWSLAAFE